MLLTFIVLGILILVVGLASYLYEKREIVKNRKAYEDWCRQVLEADRRHRDQDIFK